jgi:hypothetical protein
VLASIFSLNRALLARRVRERTIGPAQNIAADVADVDIGFRCRINEHRGIAPLGIGRPGCIIASEEATGLK